MADKKISELTELTTPDGTEELVVNDSGVSKKVQIDNLLAGGTISNFTSTGIDDNATSTAITIDASENVALAAALTVNELTTFNNYGAQAGKGRVRFGVSGAQFIEGFDIGNAGSGSYLKMGDGTTDRLTITNAGNVKVNTGNLVIGTSGKGIDFSADGNAGGMTSEVLDDYEEGTWTPTVAGLTLSSALGEYTKIGDMVYCSFIVNSSSITDANPYNITGLPFTANGIGAARAVGNPSYLVSPTSTTYGLLLLNTTSSVQFRSFTSGVAATISTLSGVLIWGTFKYKVA